MQDVCIYPSPLHEQDATYRQLSSGFEFRFEFSVFLLPDWLLYKHQRTQSVQLYTHGEYLDSFLSQEYQQRNALFRIWTRTAKSTSSHQKRLWKDVTLSILCKLAYVTPTVILRFSTDFCGATTPNRRLYCHGSKRSMELALSFKF